MADPVTHLVTHGSSGRCFNCGKTIGPLDDYTTDATLATCEAQL